MTEQSDPRSPDVEPVRTSAPDDLPVQLGVSRGELQVILIALMGFPGHGGPDQPPEWMASEFHSLIGRDIEMLKPLVDHLRAVRREVDAPFIEAAARTEPPKAE